MTTATAATTTTKRHPVRGFLYGIPFGLGLAMMANASKIALTTPLSKHIPLEKRSCRVLELGLCPFIHDCLDAFVPPDEFGE